jgi:hypothetical protein
MKEMIAARGAAYQPYRLNGVCRVARIWHKIKD